jgi:UPF0271 protein
MDINCDLGEGEPLAKTRRILRWVTSANIACGGHAGSARTMRSCLRLCGEFGVNAGAHPGFEDRQNFGRREEAISQPRLKALIESRWDAGLPRMRTCGSAHQASAPLPCVEHDRRLARGYVTFIRERFPGIRIIASPNGHVIPAAIRCGVEVWGELFSDRAYAADGGLVPRSQAGAILRDLKDIRTRMEIFRSSGRLPAEDGRLTAIAARTVCVHADSPGALRIARLLAELFRNDGVGLAARRKSTAR